jgi:transcription initiation factor TFIID subunit 8
LFLVQLRFLSLVHSSMTLSHRTSPIPHDFIVALQHFNLSPSDLEPHLELPPAPRITQPSIKVDLASEIQPVKLDKVLGSDLIISASVSSDGPSAQLISAQKRRTFGKYIPKHLPELPSVHTWQTTDIWPTERHERREDGEVEAKRMRERATEEGVMAEQALRRLMMASKNAAPAYLTANPDDGMRNSPRQSKLKSILDSAKDAILEMDQDAKAQEEAEEAAAVAEFDDPMLDLSAALEQEPPPPAKLRKAKAMLEEEEEREDGVDGMLSLAVNCDKRYWRESARGRH